jgi:outer membrane receptor for ferrienterochelin and colicins
MRWWLPVVFLLVLTNLRAQVTGTVKGQIQGEEILLPGATVFWQGTNTFALTDEKGRFQIKRNPESALLTASFVGFEPVTQIVDKDGAVHFILVEQTLEEVEILERIRATSIDVKSAALTFEMGKKELAKAACCNLSESFETNASIDVAYTDAVTGARQIELLGLAGKYAQLQTEMIPFGRGLLSALSLTYIPGTWISSIQVSKGVGSVANGYEGMTGQINLELMKPQDPPKTWANLYIGENGRTEANLVQQFQLSEKWSTGVLAHYNIRPLRLDMNGNGFMDVAMGNQVNLMNRWKYQGTKGWEAQMYLRGIRDITQSGQMDADFSKPADQQETWAGVMEVSRLEAMGKLGYVFPEAPYKSFGLIGSISETNIQAGFGNNRYLANQRSAYFNGLFHSIIGTTKHTYTTGLSMMYDLYDKDIFLSQSGEQAISNRREMVPGGFFEYNWLPGDQMTTVLGYRMDFHNTLGLFHTPRIHWRYAPVEGKTIRVGAGTGWRTPHAIMEQISALATNRRILTPSGFAALDQNPIAETSRNMGISYVQDFRLNFRKGTLVADYYYTDFTNQLVADWDVSSQLLLIYPLEGRSFSHAATITVDYEIARRWDVRLAYKFLDARTQFIDGLLERPLIPRHRGLANIAYETRNHWKFDLTFNAFGSKRIPVTGDFNPDISMPERSPAFMMVHAQINKEFSERIEVYIGGENLNNFRQRSPILNPENPFSDGFDSSLVWGPVFGRMLYLGVNFKLD